jgi:hypothetical protein
MIGPVLEIAQRQCLEEWIRPDSFWRWFDRSRQRRQRHVRCRRGIISIAMFDSDLSRLPGKNEIAS